MLIGDRIKELRVKLGLSQGELGSRVDTDSTIISRWETNRVRPSQKYIVSLAKALGTSTDYLLGKTDEHQTVADNTLTSEPVVSGETTPYTQAQTVNRGMLIYDLGNGKKIELPPTEASYDFLKEIALRTAQVAVL